MRQYPLFSLQRYSELQLAILDKTFGYPLHHGYNSLLAQYKIPYHRVPLLLVIKTFPLKKGARESSFHLFTKNPINSINFVEFELGVELSEPLSSVLWSTLRQILKIFKKILGQTLKFQVKKEFPFPCIPIFKKILTIKKNHMNKKDTYFPLYSFLKNCNYKKEL